MKKYYSDEELKLWARSFKAVNSEENDLYKERFRMGLDDRQRAVFDREMNDLVKQLEIGENEV